MSGGGLLFSAAVGTLYVARAAPLNGRTTITHTRGGGAHFRPETAPFAGRSARASDAARAGGGLQARLDWSALMTSRGG